MPPEPPPFHVSVRSWAHIRSSDFVATVGVSITSSRFEACPASSSIGSSTRTTLPNESRIIRPKPLGSAEATAGSSEAEDWAYSIVEDEAIRCS